MNKSNNLIINIAELLINGETTINYKSKIIYCSIVSDFMHKSFYLSSPSWITRSFNIDNIIKILHGTYYGIKSRDIRRGLYITKTDFNELRNKVNSNGLE